MKYVISLYSTSKYAYFHSFDVNFKTKKSKNDHNNDAKWCIAQAKPVWSFTSFYIIVLGFISSKNCAETMKNHILPGTPCQLLAYSTEIKERFCRISYVNLHIICSFFSRNAPTKNSDSIGHAIKIHKITNSCVFPIFQSFIIFRLHEVPQLKTEKHTRLTQYFFNRITIKTFNALINKFLSDFTFYFLYRITNHLLWVFD